MSINVQSNDREVIIGLGEKFDLDSVEEFRNAYTNHQGNSFIVDFRETAYMDSSGLGMLLNMRRHLGDDDTSNIRLVNCRPQIKRILMISRFEQKFSIR